MSVARVKKKQNKTIGEKRKLVPCSPRGVKFYAARQYLFFFFSLTFLNSFNVSLETRDFNSESLAFTTWIKRLLVLQLKNPRYNIVYFPPCFCLAGSFWWEILMRTWNVKNGSAKYSRCDSDPRMFLFGNILNLCPHYTYVHNFTGSLKCMSDVADRGLCDISIDA